MAAPAPTLSVSAPAPAVRERRKLKLYPYMWMSPAIIFVTAATILPILYTVYISFTNYNVNHLYSFSWVGLRNYAYAISTDPITGYASAYLWLFAWSLVFALSCTFLNVSVGLFLATLVNNPKLPGKVLFRALLIIPWTLPFFITAATWKGILNTNFGALNYLLHDLGIAASPGWLDDPNLAKISVILVNLWFSFPFFMVTSLGILQSIPPELYEAAHIDGAGARARFRHITLPGIRPALLPIVVAQFAFQFNNALIIYAVTGGNPPSLDPSGRGETDILASYLFKLVLTSQQFAQAAALGVLIFILVMVLSIINIRVTGAFREA